MGDHRCILCVDFVTSKKEAMKRHVAIVHGEDTFSTMQCDVCQRKFYDFDHFQEHVPETPTCSSDGFKIMPLQLTEQVEKGFISLVDQMMKPVLIQNISISSTESSDPPKSVVQATASPNKASTLQNSSSSSIKRSIEIEIIDVSETPEIISSESIMDQTPMSAESGILNMENEMIVDSSATQETEMQHHVADLDAVEKMDKDGFGPKLERKSCKSVGRSSVTSKRISSLAIKKSGQHQTRSNRSMVDLRHHCRQIIVKHLRKNRITCSVCKSSIVATELNGTPKHSLALNHALRHLAVPIFKCQECDYKANYVYQMRGHATGNHVSMDRYIDTTPDRIGELMELVTRCFDQDVSNRLGILSVGIETIGQEMETDQGMPIGENGSNSNSGESTVASGIKLRRSMRKIMIIGTNPMGPKGIKRMAIQQRKPRCKSDPGKKNGHAKNSPMKKWSATPAHVLMARRECLEKVQKSVKNGKLQCQLCPQSIVVLERTGIVDKFLPAIAHATLHLEGCHLFECSKCHTVTKTRIAMYYHLKRCQNGGQGKCIDRSNQYYREIFAQFLKCFDLEKASEEQPTTSTGMEKEKTENGKLSGECSTSAPTDSRKWLVCDKCQYKSEYQRLLDMHQKVIHSKQVN